MERVASIVSSYHQQGSKESICQNVWLFLQSGFNWDCRCSQWRDKNSELTWHSRSSLGAGCDKTQRISAASLPSPWPCQGAAVGVPWHSLQRRKELCHHVISLHCFEMLMTTRCWDRVFGSFILPLLCSSLSLSCVSLVKAAILYTMHYQCNPGCRALVCHTPGAELHHLAPLWHQVVAVRLADCSLDSDAVLRPRAEEPVAPHCHGKRHSLGHQLGWHILEGKARGSRRQVRDARM